MLERLPAEIRSEVRGYLSLQDTLSLARASPMLWREQWTSKQWNVHAFLRDVFAIRDTDVFLQCMCDAGGSMSGRAIIMFLVGERWETPPPLEIRIRCPGAGSFDMERELRRLVAVLRSFGYGPMEPADPIRPAEKAMPLTEYNMNNSRMGVSCHVVVDSHGEAVASSLQRRTSGRLLYRPDGAFLYPDRVECFYPYSTLLRKKLFTFASANLSPEYGVRKVLLRHGWRDETLTSSQAVSVWDNQPRLSLFVGASGFVSSRSSLPAGPLVARRVDSLFMAAALDRHCADSFPG
ncbi:hypothetical protein Micbo1qcDRAFT_225476 [Microdochium bolleyi]|uniref:F-box domain-containing protein n=1 Tax=Microdochium bolleyi TaxID=196109 RepID=A0A136IJ03_9PEZI|nr:hypothetical protein Micbo1qcDRAFT_225476 [Microdochium bolleyi]